jgi:hypothetical protein
MANSNGWGDASANNSIGWGQGANNAIGWGDIHADSWAGLTDIVGVQATSLLLDDYTNAAVAYSLRQLRTAYTGNAIRVRRSSDNTEQNFGFIGGELDTASLLSFVGANNGFITTWYDQSGNGLNLTQTAVLNQPRIVTAGVIDTKDGTTAMRFNGTSHSINRTAISALNAGNNYSFFTVSSNNDTSTFDTIFNTSDSGPGGRLDNFNDTRTTDGSYRNFLISNTSLTNYEANLSEANGSTNQRLLSGFVNGFNMSAFNNGNTGGTNTYTGTYGNSTFQIAKFAGIRWLNGYIQEIIIYPTDQSSNRVGIETNINTYYTIF